MREIKFRAWDKKEKYMFVPHCGTDDINKEIKEAQEMYELMQYTWLKDKNGKEIYEGDYLLSTDRWQKERFKWIVIWDVARFCVNYKNLKNKTSTELTWVSEPWILENWEIIWNIYENSELIEKESV